jgi:hypothetical protein
VFTNFAEIHYNWRKAKFGYPKQMPSITTLENEKVNLSDNYVFLPWGTWDDVISIRDWLAENLGSRLNSVRLYARFAWYQKTFETKRAFMGLIFHFANDMDYVLFKLRWQQAM